MRSFGKVCTIVVGACLLLQSLRAQELTIEDYQKLRINEIIAANATIEPQNWRCRYVDMVEIFNGSEKTLPLAGALGHVRLTDHSLNGLSLLKRFLSFRGQAVQVIEAGARIVLFCDGFSNRFNRTPACENVPDRSQLDALELHATFRLSSNGERLTLEFVPIDDPASPIELHDVCYPPLRRDYSYARIPESADNLDGWVFSATPTFGACTVPDVLPPSGEATAYCIGDANATMVGVESDLVVPDLERIDYSTNNVGADEPVDFRVRVNDDRAPDQSNIQRVEIRYRVDGGAEQMAAMSFVTLLTEDIDPTGPGGDRAQCPPSGLDSWSIWEGSIPGQAAGAHVEFHFFVEDVDGLTDIVPGSEICPDGVGPCDPANLEDDVLGCTADQDCDTPLNYRVATESDLGLVINEIVPNNDAIIADPSELELDCPVLSLNCPFDDFMEIYNASGVEQSLDDVVVARGPYHPERGWRFPPGARIGPGEYRLVWIDGDGVDPVPPAVTPLNPNDVSKNWFHTDSRIDSTRDELTLYEIDESTEGGPTFRWIDGVRWGTSGGYFSSNLRGAPDVTPLPLPTSGGTLESLLVDQSMARSPNGDPSSPIHVLDRVEVTPAGPNPTKGGTIFRRGDVNGSGVTDITDASLHLQFQFIGDVPMNCHDAGDADDNGALDINDPLKILIALFLGTPPLPDPGLSSCGLDPSDDALPPCIYPAEKCQ